VQVGAATKAPHRMPSAPLQEIELSDASALDAALDVLRGERPVFLLEMPAVHALVAPATKRGARALDEAKVRLPGKTYGSMIGEVGAFYELADPAVLPPPLRRPAAFAGFEGAFVRVRLRAAPVTTATVREGTHQGLMFADGAHRRFAAGLEDGLASMAEPDLFGGLAYTAPLCTSANLSGDSRGTITDEARAAAFARDRGVRLWIRAPRDVDARGSYPAFSLSREGFTVERDGPGRAEIERRLHEALG